MITRNQFIGLIKEAGGKADWIAKAPKTLKNLRRWHADAMRKALSAPHFGAGSSITRVYEAYEQAAQRKLTNILSLIRNKAPQFQENKINSVAKLLNEGNSTYPAEVYARMLRGVGNLPGEKITHPMTERDLVNAIIDRTNQLNAYM